MLSNINMEFIHAFNPLYAAPIVAVILCAFIVYALGFKSPVQPPSFEGIEEEKKNSKKRRGKETQKSNKLIQNGKVNGSTVSKSVAVPTKKKESIEKYSLSEKTSSSEKTTATAEKKASKKNKAQNEKKLPQERKKESITHDEFNDDGWVQLISKKGRKNRKKDDNASLETTTSVLGKVTKANQSDDSSPMEEFPQKNVDLPSLDISAQSTKDRKQPSPAAVDKKVLKETKSVTSTQKPKIQDLIPEASKPGNNIEKSLPKEIAPKEIKVLEESNKSKKKKKKNTEPVLAENKSVHDISSSISESSKVQVNLETVAPIKIDISNSDISDSPQVNSSEVEGNPPSLSLSKVKTSNVAFDELAGLYPEPKEQKKKKKVRRDH